jgi:hypothetical protein
MKHPIIIAVLVVFSSTLFPAGTNGDEIQEFERHFSVRLIGGMDWLVNNDWVKHYKVLPNGEEYGTKPNWGWDGGVEVNYHFHPTYSLAIGVNRYRTSLEYEDKYTFRSENPYSFAWKYITDAGTFRAQTVPVTLTLYGNSLSYPFQTFAGIGIGYYFSNISWDSNYLQTGSQGVDKDLNKKADLSGGAFGFHWTLGWKYFFNPRFALTAEFNGRHARIGCYNGSLKKVIDNIEQTEEDGRLIYREFDDEQSFGMVRRGELFVAPENWRNDRDYRVRNGEMDFGGLSFKFGMACHF